jgi:hypothetical protein
MHPTPPPFLPQPHEKKAVMPKKHRLTSRNKALAHPPLPESGSSNSTDPADTAQKTELRFNFSLQKDIS